MMTKNEFLDKYNNSIEVVGVIEKTANQIKLKILESVKKDDDIFINYYSKTTSVRMILVEGGNAIMELRSKLRVACQIDVNLDEFNKVLVNNQSILDDLRNLLLFFISIESLKNAYLIQMIDKKGFLMLYTDKKIRMCGLHSIDELKNTATFITSHGFDEFNKLNNASASTVEFFKDIKNAETFKISDIRDFILT